jgi:hypothetical protein
LLFYSCRPDSDRPRQPRYTGFRVCIPDRTFSLMVSMVANLCWSSMLALKALVKKSEAPSLQGRDGFVR